MSHFAHCAPARNESGSKKSRNGFLRRLHRKQLKATYDIAVVGSGFGGSLLGMIARRLGHSVILLEKGQHPRFAIGESSTPLSNILLEQLAARFDLPGI